MSELDVAAIRARHATYVERTAGRPRSRSCPAHDTADDVPALSDALAARDARVAELEADRDRYRTAARSCTVWHGAICTDAAKPPASTAPLAAGHPHVAGRCPACHRASLFVGAGGYVTCAQVDCPDPGAASDLLDPSAPIPRTGVENTAARPPGATRSPRAGGATPDGP